MMPPPFRALLLIFSLFIIPLVDGAAQVRSPSSFLGYEPGERFTRHHDLTAYFEHVAEESDFVQLEQYGESYQNRPLFAVFVSSRENMRALDTIRVNNRRMTGLDDGEISGSTATILWLSYGIHGNEASSPEAAMLTLYELVSGAESPTGKQSGDISGWLEETVVVMDPVLNPDGRERYVNWYDQTEGRRPDYRPEAREHHEPWPGGRSNHYYFDLNRDWAWQTQIESRQRIAFYRRWMPQVHADFHEMFRNDYYFPPAAEPMHSAITPWQREFQSIAGENHAAHFDDRFERYFTGEVFDLLYPGYGDTWPTFNGAIGMTYEQMGHARAGKMMVMEDGDTLTLDRRIRNHKIIGLSTVEVTAQNSERLQNEFREFFRDAQEEPDGSYESYVVSGNNHPDRLGALLDFLDQQEIRYGKAEEDRSMTGYHYMTGEEQSRRTEEEDIIIPLRQPKSALTRVLFDPDPELADSNTYDITAWALPYAYGLDAWAVEGRLRITDEPVQGKEQYEPLPEEEVYGYAIQWGDVRDAAFLANLLQAGVRVQLAEQSFTVNNSTFPAGSILVLKSSNRSMGERLSNVVDSAAARHDRKVSVLRSGQVDDGPGLASPRVPDLEKPVVAVPGGEPLQAYNVGEIRYYFDYTLDYPLGVFDPDRLSSFPLEDYNVLILPEGRYDLWKDSEWKKLMNWVDGGGRVIAFSDAVRALAAREETGITLRSFDEDGLENEDDLENEDRIRFEDRRSHALTRRISGSVFRVQLDDSHPLAYGLGEDYASLKRGTLLPEPLDTGWNVGLIPQEDPLLSGWSGAEAVSLTEGSLVAGTASIGQGQIVILADNPLFRGFWRNGELLFSNALFQAWIAL